MLNKRNITLAGLLVLVVFLIAGFTAILERRFAEGGIYPHYASFRPDPLGTSVFYESLEAMEGVEVRRNITHLNSIKGLDEDSALLLLGYPRESLEDLRAPEDSPVLAAVEAGARLVITLNPGLVPEVFRPEEDDWIDRRENLKKEASRKKMKKEKPKRESAEHSEGEGAESIERKKSEVEEAEEKIEQIEKQIESMAGLRLTDKLEFDLTVEEDFKRPEAGWKTRLGKPLVKSGVIESPPRWRSQYRVSVGGSDWKTVLRVKKEPVVIERKWGAGTIVFATDSFFASNEALHDSSSPDFLLWLLGGKREVVFDETIHGTRETGGAMKLIRRYRLHGFFLGMLVFVGLWAWRSASSLAPGSDMMDRGLVGGGAVSGEHSRSGLVRLLRRSVPGKELLQRCFSVWKESQHRELSGDVAAEIAAVLKDNEAKPATTVSAYQKITALVARRWGQGVDKVDGKREEETSL